MRVLKAAFVCLILAAVGLVLIPFAVAKIAGGIFAVMFLVLLLADLAQTGASAA
jgi:hypothetical protein